VAENHNFWHILTFGELQYRPPFTDEGTFTFTCQNLSRSVYSIALWWRNPPIFAVFLTSAFSVVDSWRQFEKVEHGCTTTNLPLSNGIKIISVLQRLHGEIEHTNSDIQKREGQKKRDGLTKTLTFFAATAAIPTKLGMVIEDLEHVLAPLKRLGV